MCRLPKPGTFRLVQPFPASNIANEIELQEVDIDTSVQNEYGDVLLEDDEEGEELRQRRAGQ